MAKGKTYRVPRRRRREGKTDYRKRIKLIKSGKKRLVVRIQNNTIIAQIIEYNPEGDKTITQAISRELEKYGYEGNCSNTPAAYLTGILIGKRAQEKSVKEAVLDIGQNTPIKESKVFAVLKGALESGLDIPHGKEALPKDKRIKGEHIEEHRGEELKVEKIAEEIKEE